MVLLPLALIILVGILFVWILHTATIYALPLVVGWGAATLAFKAGAGLEGSAILAVTAAIGTLVSLRFILERMPNGPARSMIAFMLIIPSLIMGYNIGLDLLESVVPSDMWRHAISTSYAVFGGWLAFVRLTEIKE